MSQHTYTLADQLGAFDMDFDLEGANHNNHGSNGSENGNGHNGVGGAYYDNDKNADADEQADTEESEHANTNIRDTKGLYSPVMGSPLGSPLSQTSSVASTRWTIGWVTPSAILSLFLIAVALATAHLGFFRYLDGRQVDKTISQPYVAAISLAFVNAFRTLLAAALGISFVQIVWNVLRRQPMQLVDLDRLLSVLGNPLQLGRVGLLWRVPVPFLCALLCWCLPIAMVFPTGALTVEATTVSNRSTRAVPSFDPNYIGNGTMQDMLANALWAPDNFDNYAGPNNKVIRVAQQSILAGSYVSSPSTCGQNCSYSISITAPSFQCNDSVSSNLFNWVNSTYQQYDAYYYLYAASADEDALTNPAQDEFVFELSWLQNGNQTRGYQNLSCTAYEAVYALQISYQDGQETVTTISVEQGQRLNSSNFYEDYGMEPQDGSNATINSTTIGQAGYNVMETNKMANMAAIQDTVVDALSGYIDALILHAQQTSNTIIALSDLYSGSGNAVTFNITQDSMQDLLQNIVISMLSLNQTTTNTTVTQTTNVNVYSFSNPARLIGPYFLSIFMSLWFIAWGGHALVSNGISASTGGLFQTLCTTRGSDRLHDLAAKGCLGGRENVPDDLKNLKVMFGVLNHESERRMTGLGTEEEVVPLVKGAF